MKVVKTADADGPLLHTVKGAAEDLKLESMHGRGLKIQGSFITFVNLLVVPLQMGVLR